MEYLLFDTHRRFLGTMNYDRPLKAGDIFQNAQAQTYAIVGSEPSGSRGIPYRALTVVAVNPPRKVA